MGYAPRKRIATNRIELSGDIAPDLFGIEPIKAKEMISGLSTTLAEREVLKNAYIDVIELPINAENLAVFKELRLKIVKNRTQGIEKWHKTNKAFYLAGGRFVDAIKNKEVLENEQMEAKLLEGEKYFENLEKERLNTLRLEREELLRPYVETLPNDLSSLDQDVFDSFLETKKKSFADKLEADRIEAERVENERIEREKQIEAQRLENERLKKEAEIKSLRDKERGKQLQPYISYIRDYNALLEMSDDDFDKNFKILHKGAILQMKYESDQLAKKENEEAAERKQKQLEFEKATEIRLKKEAEEKVESERLKVEAVAKKEAEKLAKAPIKKQLTAWVVHFELPSTNVDNEVSKEIKEKFEAFKKWSLTQVNNL